MQPIPASKPATARPKLIIQIPCWNEEEALPTTLAALPRSFHGIGATEVLVISDGSEDRTVPVARNLKVEHVLDLKTHQGLAKAFSAGLAHATKLGADYLVNLDADNQYCAEDIPKLLEPLIEGRADIVVGERPIQEIEHFSALKKKLQSVGSSTVRRLAGVQVKDTPSGFRAYNRRAMLRLCIFGEFTYTHESLIAARDAGLHVVGTPIRVNDGVVRPSRLMRSMWHYVLAGSGGILRFYLLYNPRSLLLWAATFVGLLGAILWMRFLYYFITGDGNGHVQSLILAAVLIIASMFTFMLAVFADIMRTQRLLLQEMLSLLRETAYGREKPRPEGTDREP